MATSLRSGRFQRAEFARAALRCHQCLTRRSGGQSAESGILLREHAAGTDTRLDNAEIGSHAIP
jgi:hypothetical protein